MVKIRSILYFIVFSLAVMACSIQISPALIATPSPQAPLATMPAFLTLVSPEPQTGLATPTLPSHPKIRVTWGDLNLSGRLIYVSGGEQVDSMVMNIQSLDLKTGEITTIFHGADNSWIYSVDVSPDGKQLVMTYSPPLENKGIGNPTLYIMPIDGTKPPQLLFTPFAKDDEYFQPDWSADGKYIYFTYISRKPSTPQGQLYPDYQVYRMSYPSGRLEKIADQAFWPRASADLQHLVYVTTDPTDGTNKLFLANPDGTNPQQIVMSAKWVPSYIDAPIFSPDGQSILFSALSLSQASAPTWLEKLLGMTVASAHSIPSDWWSVPIHGGAAIQITHIQTTSLFASISPDKKYIASNSGAGIFLMHPDGTGLAMLTNDSGGVPGTVSWIP